MAKSVHLVVPAWAFHADDVLCAAMARVVGDHPWIERRDSMQFQEMSNCYFT